MGENKIVELKKSFDDYKRVDENGKEYWDSRELSKAMGYSRYRNFEPAIERAKTQMENTGKNPEDHMAQSRHMINTGKGATREVESYELDKLAAYNVAMNADPSKMEVAFAQEYFLQSTAKAEVIEQRMKTLSDINNRNQLRIANKIVNNEILSRDVEPEEMGIPLNSGDLGMFDKSTKEMKEHLNVPDNRPLADFIGGEVAAYKTVAQYNALNTMKKHNLRGVEAISEVMYDKNRVMREMFIEEYGEAPENRTTGEDIKKIEAKYKKQTKRYQDALNYEA